MLTINPIRNSLWQMVRPYCAHVSETTQHADNTGNLPGAVTSLSTVPRSREICTLRLHPLDRACKCDAGCGVCETSAQCAKRPASQCCCCCCCCDDLQTSKPLRFAWCVYLLSLLGLFVSSGVSTVRDSSTQVPATASTSESADCP